MAEDNTALKQQLEQNLAAFEGAGLDEEAKSTRAKLDKLNKPARSETKTTKGKK